MSDTGRDAPEQENADDTLSAVRNMIEQAAQPEEGGVGGPAKQPAEQTTEPTAHAAQHAVANPNGAASAAHKALPKLQAAEEPDAGRTTGVLALLSGLVPRRRKAPEVEEIVPPAPKAPAAAHANDDFSDLSENSFRRFARGVMESRPVMAMRHRLAEYEPSKKHAAFIAFVAVMLWRPWLIPGLLFLALFVAAIAYFTLGPDRASELIQSGWEQFAKRQPERAERWLVKIQRGADRVDGWISKLPDSWTDGVYLPDLGRSAGVEEAAGDKDDPFERLAAERDADLGRPGPLGV